MVPQDGGLLVREFSTVMNHPAASVVAQVCCATIFLIDMFLFGFVKSSKDFPFCG